jgi:arylsulfatase A-like enzyme
MDHKLFFKYGISCFLIFLLVFQTACEPGAEKNQRPNIVLIMGDDIGFSDIGCYGSEITTPNLDKLATQGMRFRQFYNMSKCETTRSVMLTGHYTGDERSVSLAAVLKDAGYYTIHSGKEHFTAWVPKHVYAENVFHESYTFWAANEFFIPPDSVFQRPFKMQGKELHARELIL